jgi:hypothetical protein
MNFLCFIGLHKYKLPQDGTNTFRRKCVKCDHDRCGRVRRKDMVKRKNMIFEVLRWD